MPSKYVDPTAIIQVVGNVYNNPNILEYTDKYSIVDEDFVNEFHKIVFGTIYKLHELGAKQISLEAINDFLNARPKSFAVYKQNKGDEWVLQASNNAQESSFDYYYGRMKKMSLLRAYDNYGIDVRDIYDPDNILDSKKKQYQEEWLDNSCLEDIANKVDGKIEQIRLQYVDNAWGESYQAGDGLENLIEGQAIYFEPDNFGRSN